MNKMKVYTNLFNEPAEIDVVYANELGVFAKLADNVDDALIRIPYSAIATYKRRFGKQRLHKLMQLHYPKPPKLEKVAEVPTPEDVEKLLK